MSAFVGFREGSIKFMNIVAKSPVFPFGPATQLDPERV
jgi:hypothetical protein